MEIFDDPEKKKLQGVIDSTSLTGAKKMPLISVKFFLGLFMFFSITVFLTGNLSTLQNWV